MKLEKIEGSENYVCTVVNLPPKEDVPGLDNLKKVTVFGNDCLVGKDDDSTSLHLFFPAECKLADWFLKDNNLYRDKTRNRDNTKGGFFEDTGRVKSIKFKGVISTGFVVPIISLAGLGGRLNVGDEFNTIDGTEVCRKYKVVRIQSTTSKESRFNKKLKRFDKLVPNQFRFHESTSHLAKNLHLFNPEDIITVTDKWHGTSAIYSNVLVRKKLSLLARVVKALGVEVVDKKYDLLYASRTVVKNKYINEEVTTGYYNEDIWGIVKKEIEGKVEQGITIYGEIVGYLPSGRMIQKGYDYCADPGLVGKLEDEGELRVTNFDLAQHRFVVYRITYTKPDGNTIEFSWQQIKDYCKKYDLETVKELYFGKLEQVFETTTNSFNPDYLLEDLASVYLEGDCKHCKNKVPAEGIVVRIDGRSSYSAFKLKSKRFLERETKELDKGEANIEDEEVETTTKQTNNEV